MRTLSSRLLAAALVLGPATAALAEQAQYYRFSPSKGSDGTSDPSAPSAGGNAVMAVTAQPSGFAGVPGEQVTSAPPILANAAPPVSYALISPAGDITASLPSRCQGLTFDTSQGTVQGNPTGGCLVEGLRIVSTDAGGKQASSDPFAISIGEASVIVSQNSVGLLEGDILRVQGTTNIPSPTWSVTGAPFGSSASVSPSGLLTVYATDVDAYSSYVLNLTATGKSVAKSAAVTYGVTPQTVLITAPDRTRSGLPFALQSGTAATYPGEWMGGPGTGDLSLSFLSLRSPTTNVTGRAPQNTGSTIINRTIGTSFVATNTPSGAVPATVSGQTNLQIFPTLAIVDVLPSYSVAEGQELRISPNAAAGSLMGGTLWSMEGLPTALKQESSTGNVTGTVPGGAAAASPYAGRITVLDMGDAGTGKNATKAFQVTVAPATLLSANPKSLAVADLVLPTAKGPCTAFQVTNGGSQGATSLAYAVTSGGDFEACVPTTTANPNCGTTLAYNATCQFGARLISTSNGPKTGTSTVTAGNGTPVAVPLTGTVTGGGLYPFAAFTFSNCNATGRFGPTPDACRIAYSSQSWTQDTAFLSQSSPGIQLWTVPKTGSYRITARGAQGGSTTTNAGGPGRVLRGTFTLQQGERIKILVGQKGDDVTASYWDAAGGGGTFVTTEANAALIVAGAGSGAGYGGQSGSTQYGTEGYGASGSTTGGSSGGGIAGGTNGGAGTSTQYACSGAGLTGNGYRTTPADYDCSPLSFVNGGTGGNYSGPTYKFVGGFGGGAGVYGGGSLGSGAGGGYSGGGAGRAEASPKNISGGGGSFNSGASPLDSGAGNLGHGSVYIEPL